MNDERETLHRAGLSEAVEICTSTTSTTFVLVIYTTGSHIILMMSINDVIIIL